MYSSTGSAEQSRESVNSSYDVLNSRLMPRAGNTADEELVFRSDSRSSKTSQNQQYMNTLSTGQKARNTLTASQTRVNSPGASTTSVNQQAMLPGRSHSSAGHYGGGSQKPNRVASRSSAGPHTGGSANSSGSSEDSMMKQKQGGHQRGKGSVGGASMTKKQAVDARGFLRTLNDLFFSKFCVDELFYREFREQLVKRIQESTYRYDPEDLQDILDDVSEACKSTRLNLDAVSQWRLNYFTRDQTASVVDYIFLINVNMMAYDAKYSNRCLDSFCADPLCSEIHAGRVTEADKAKAFRRVINVIMNEAVRVRLVSRDQKSAVRARLVKAAFACEDRINVVRELAVLILLAQDERHRAVVQHALVGFGQTWTPADGSSQVDADEDCNLDPDMVYRKALGAINNAYLESVLDVRRLGMSISAEEVGKLRELWARASTKTPTNSSVLTLPMLLHLLVHCSESELQAALPQAGVSAAALAKSGGGLAGRIEQVEDAALQIVQNLGLAWELGDNPPRDLRQFCMVLLLDLGSVLSMLLVPDPSSSASTDQQPDSDQLEIGVVEDGLFARWWDVCDAVVAYERAHRHFYAAFLATYVKLASEKLLAQKADFDPELFLTMVVELLTEFRKRRPDYDAIVMTVDGRIAPSAAASLGSDGSGTISARSSSAGGNDAGGGGKVMLDRRTREDIGAEFDRLFAWVDQQLPVTNRVRALARAQSPRSKTNSWQQMQQMGVPRSTSSASVGYGSATGGNRVASPVPPMPMHR